MTNDLMTKQAVDEKMIKDFLFTSETKLSDKQQQMFMQIAIRHNLDPFKREVYAIAYGNEFSVITGYEVYIKRAEATGQLDGWTCENTEDGAEITIHRKDWDKPFHWVALYEEFDKGQSSWKKMRKFMIKKVVIGQGFRLAFPTELGGMPYLKEEIVGQTPFEKPPVQKTQAKSKSKPQDNTGEEVITQIASVTKKSGGTEKKPWTKYTIHSVGDTKYSTFDHTFAQIAADAVGSGSECLILFKHNEQYKSNEIESLEAMPEELPEFDEAMVGQE